MNIEMSCKLCIHFLRGCCEQAEYKMDIPDPVIVGVTESQGGSAHLEDCRSADLVLIREV